MSHLLIPQTAGPFEAKFHVKPPWVGGTKVCSGGLGHMTKMSTKPIYGKNPLKIRVATGQGKVREICKLVREILNTKNVREKSGNFIILAQNMCCSRYFDYMKYEKSVDFFYRSLRSLKTIKTC